MYRLVQRRGIIGLFCLLFVASSVVPGWAQKDNRFEVSKNLDIFNSLLKEVEMFYVDSVDVDKTVQRGIEAMLAGLDPYTEYYPEQKTEELSLMTTGEYGGIGLVIEGNTWVNDKKNWGYVKFNTSDEVTNEYIKYGRHLLELIRKGFSAAVYTQTTDVEGEINGLMTYDRKVIKMNEAKVREINQQICNSLNK